MGDKIVVNEVGLRDGLQIHPTFVPTADKLALLDALMAAGLRSFEVSSFVSPKAVPQMADAAALFAGLPRRADVTYAALVPNERGYERAAEAGVTSVALVLATTDTFNRRNINMTLNRATEVCRRVIGRARTDGLHVRAYLSAAFACPYEGPTPPAVVYRLAAELFDAGAHELAIGDTIGAGNPSQASEVFGFLAGEYGPERLAAHFHDTRAMGLVLAWAALEAGVRKFDSSVGGLGGCPFAPGASGNLATEDLVLMLNESGYETGIDVAGLRRAVGIAEEITGATLGGRVSTWLLAQERRRAAGA